MGRPRKRPMYVIVEAEILGSIGKDRVLAIDSEPDENLLDELQCPLADEVLIALRKSFSLTFPRNPFIEGLQEALREIRRVGIEALRTIPEIIEELQLKPLPPVNAERRDYKAYLLKYCFARIADLQVKVKYEGRSHKLIDLINARPADEVVRTLREIVSDTFSEMHSEEQHEEALRSIRQRIGSTLPAFNDVFVDIEIEPIADLSLLNTVESESESLDDHSATDSKSTGDTPSVGKPSPK